MTLTLCVPDGAQYDPIRHSDAFFMREYARLAGIAELETALTPFMVVVSAMRLADLGLVPGEEERLVACVREARV
jgi:hypothetical protein